MAALHELDEVAYVRFASVYRQFKDLEDFVRELRELLESRGERGADFPLAALNASPKK
jgi:transcriptional repressor NrdR